MTRACPFCGYGDKLSVIYDTDAMLAALKCGRCGATGPKSEMERHAPLHAAMTKAASTALMTWNDRRCDSLTKSKRRVS